MGDPTTVPEDSALMGYAAAPEPDEPEVEPLSLKMPAELATYFDVGFCHTDIICPYVVLRVRDDTTQAPVEVSGPPSAFLGLAQIIAALCEAVPCLVAHGAGGEAEHYEQAVS